MSDPNFLMSETSVEIGMILVAQSDMDKGRLMDCA